MFEMRACLLLLLRVFTVLLQSSAAVDDGGGVIHRDGSRMLREQKFDYDEDMAKMAVVYSSAAYTQNPSVANWTFVNPACNNKTEGFSVVQTYVGAGTEAFGYVGLDPVNKRIVVAFKGTSDLRDWITDLRTWLTYNKRCAPAGDKSALSEGFPPVYGARTSDSVPLASRPSGLRAVRQESPAEGVGLENDQEWWREKYVGMGWGGRREDAQGAEGGRQHREYRDDGDDGDDPSDDLLIGNVHFGFCEYYQSVVAEGIADRMVGLAEVYPDYSFFVTGHSLGAAAAAVCAADLTQRLGIAGERVLLYTLGEPRAGDGVFADGLSDHVGTAYRIVHKNDVVPHLSLCCHGWLGKCQPAKASCPYQHCSEVLYDNDMAPGSDFSVCNDTIGEDYGCDQQAFDMSVADHTHYFQLMVGTYCGSNPLHIPPFEVMKAQEEAKWEYYDDAMRLEDNAFVNPFGNRYSGDTLSANGIPMYDVPAEDYNPADKYDPVDSSPVDDDPGENRSRESATEKEGAVTSEEPRRQRDVSDGYWPRPQNVEVS